MTTVVRTIGLTKVFGSVVACDGITLDIEAGEVLGLLGPSGCGKTTLLRCLAGFERPTRGEVFLRDQLIASPDHFVPPEKRNIGMVFQSYALWPHLTVEENIAMPLRLRGVPQRDRPPAVRAMLERLELVGLARRYPAELSGGQQQRVALARATVIHPGLLLLDEPLSNLDAQLRDRLRDQLRLDLKELGITTIFVTHDQAEAMVIADRVALMSTGRVVQVAAPRELYERPRALFAATFVGRANVLDGRVIGMENGYAVVSAGKDLRLLCTALSELRTGSDVSVVIRPEHLSTEASGQSLNKISGRAVRTVFLGSRIDWVLDADGLTLRVELRGGAREIEQGGRVDLWVMPERALCYLREDQQAVEGAQAGPPPS